MKSRVMLLAAASAIVAAGGVGVALAHDYDDGYRTHAPYDDQAEETRRLNLLQLQNPGAGEDAVPPPGGELRDLDDDYDDDGMGGPSFSGPPSPGDMGDNDDDLPGPPDVDEDDGPMGPGGDVDDDDRY